MNKYFFEREIPQFFKSLKRRLVSIFQKIRYGTSDEECWNLYRVIAKHNLKKLQHYKKMQRYTFAAGLTEDEWEKKIDEIIWAFDYILNDEKYNPMPECGEFKVVEQEEDISQLVFDKSPECQIQWDKYLEKSKELEERKKKALVWFAENFESFWD